MSATAYATPASAPITYNYGPGVVSCLQCHRVVGSYAGLKGHTRQRHPGSGKVWPDVFITRAQNPIVTEGSISCLRCRLTVRSYRGLKCHRHSVHGDNALFAAFEAQFPLPIAERDETLRAATLRARYEYELATATAGTTCQCHHRHSKHLDGICTAVDEFGTVCECVDFFPAHRRRPRGMGRRDALRRALSLDAPAYSDGTGLTLQERLPYYVDEYDVA